MKGHGSRAERIISVNPGENGLVMAISVESDLSSTAATSDFIESEKTLASAAMRSSGGKLPEFVDRLIPFVVVDG